LIFLNKIIIKVFIKFNLKDIDSPYNDVIYISDNDNDDNDSLCSKNFIDLIQSITPNPPNTIEEKIKNNSNNNKGNNNNINNNNINNNSNNKVSKSDFININEIEEDSSNNYFNEYDFEMFNNFTNDYFYSNDHKPSNPNNNKVKNINKPDYLFDDNDNLQNQIRNIEKSSYEDSRIKRGRATEKEIYENIFSKYK